MANDSNGRQAAGAEGTSLTTRRSFIAVTSLGVVSLYGLWAGLGAAPLQFWEAGNSSEGGMKMEGGGHGEHGAAAGNPHEFRQAVDRFIEQNKQPDGSVFVERQSAGAMPGMNMSGMNMSGMDYSKEHDTGAMPENADDSAVPPPEVYILAQQWSFEPSWLKLKAGVPYRLKLMAVDAAHGASLQLGLGGRIIRLPKGVPVERDITFAKPGNYLLYCTVFCGEGHQYMSGKLEIV